MRSKMRIFLGAACLLTALAILEPVVARKALAADDKGSGPSLTGSWAFQFTGQILLPPPFNAFNGPFYRNGRFVADNHGNFSVTSANSNYNGAVGNETFSGTYIVNQDGTFTMRIVNLPVPPILGIPNVFTFNGVLADGGTKAKVVLSGVFLQGLGQLTNIGSVVAGEFIKQ